MPKLLFLFGTRPEVIKLVPLIHRFRQQPQAFECRVCFTGQHRELALQAFDFFGIQPDYDLNLMQEKQHLSGLTAALMTALEPVLQKENPDLVLVQGDTTTAFCGALSAYYAGIPVAHVEAGLRTGLIRSPFPEEFNRIAISKIAAYHFAPTEAARQNLLREGIPDAAIAVTGNTGVDALLWAKAHIEAEKSPELEAFQQQLDQKNRRIVLVTLHRREHLGAKLDGMRQALSALAARYSEVLFVLPVHPNPQVRAALEPLAGLPNMRLIPPLSYEKFVWLLSASFLILTDSGGIQEEAPSLSKPVVVLRDHTERPEAIEAGTALLAGTAPEGIIEMVSKLMDDSVAYEAMVARCVRNPFGDGRACERVVAFVNRVFNEDLSIIPATSTPNNQ
ncbi:MAG: UDP-N-acetylglucosamine 2-epimerase (non-hydrolyzing) [Saprospiraceae bacterium]|nr:UDP-N-acetylglucosamine 2-epimerase (non-hydrolyzing) [Saprospiraceae bacterium]